MSQSLIKIVNLGYGILAVNKEPGIVSCNDSFHSWGVNTLIDREYPEHDLANRIDKDTSGLLLAANSTATMRHFGNKTAFNWLKSVWHTRVKKVYLAVIPIPNWLNGQANCDADVYVDEEPKSAKTIFIVLRRSNQYALVGCMLEMHGRKHQIRQHLKHLGYPILGDRIYGGERTTNRKGQLLHAFCMSIKVNNEVLRPVAPIHCNLVDGFGWKDPSYILGDTRSAFHV